MIDLQTKYALKANRRRGASRRGVAQVLQLLLVMPILLALIFAIIEFGCLMAAQHRLEAASRVACRIASLPSDRNDEVSSAARRATVQVLGHPAMVRDYELSMERGKHTGDMVVVEIRLPMSAAAPDLLSMFGWKLSGRELVSRAVMRRE